MHVVPSTIHHSYVALSNYACNERWLDLMNEWIEGREREEQIGKNVKEGPFWYSVYVSVVKAFIFV